MNSKNVKGVVITELCVKFLQQNVGIWEIKKYIFHVKLTRSFCFMPNMITA